MGVDRPQSVLRGDVRTQRVPQGAGSISAHVLLQVPDALSLRVELRSRRGRPEVSGCWKGLDDHGDHGHSRGKHAGWTPTHSDQHERRDDDRRNRGDEHVGPSRGRHAGERPVRDLDPDAGDDNGHRGSGGRAQPREGSSRRYESNSLAQDGHATCRARRPASTAAGRASCDRIRPIGLPWNTGRWSSQSDHGPRIQMSATMNTASATEVDAGGSAYPTGQCPDHPHRGEEKEEPPRRRY